MNWWEPLAAKIERHGGCREILRDDNDGKNPLYLKRYYIWKTPIGEGFLHQFFKGDVGPLHDHPAFTCGLILNEGYTEMVADSVDAAASGTWRAIERRAGDFSWRPAKNGKANCLHKVVLRPGTEGKVWTLFIMGKRVSDWGFWTPNGWIRFDRYGNNDIPQSSHMEYQGWLFPKKNRHS